MFLKGFGWVKYIFFKKLYDCIYFNHLRGSLGGLTLYFNLLKKSLYFKHIYIKKTKTQMMII